MESPCAYVRDLQDPVLFQTALPRSGGFHLWRGGMPLYDAGGCGRV